MGTKKIDLGPTSQDWVRLISKIVLPQEVKR